MLRGNILTMKQHESPPKPTSNKSLFPRKSLRVDFVFTLAVFPSNYLLREYLKLWVEAACVSNFLMFSSFPLI